MERGRKKMLEAVSSIKSKAVEAPQNGQALSGAKIDRNQEIIEIKKAETSRKVREVKQTEQAKIERIAQAMDSYIQSVQKDLKIGIHQATGNIMVKVVSEKDGKVLREVPPEELLDLAAKMEEMVGVLVNENA